MSRKTLNIGLYGFGCVGFGLYEVLSKTPALNALITKICVKNPDKKRVLDVEYFTYDRNEILNDESINVVVELIDDADAAFQIVSAALRKGKAVVSANKKMIAEHFEELLALQQEYKTPLLYEGACCASIPIIRNLEEYYDNDLLQSIEGIVNGSTNYILSKTATEGLSYSSALRQAQELGFAESNPILDTGGFDAKYKLIILLAHAFRHIAKPNEVINYGIDKINSIDLNYAAEKNLKIKLVAQAFKNTDGSLSAFVAPRFVSRQEWLYNVDDVFNGILAKTSFADTQFFVGKGAGAHPTASAVLSDISALSYDYRYEYKKIRNQENVVFSNQLQLKVLLSYKVVDTTTLKIAFNEITEEYNNLKEGYLIGIISLNSLTKIVSQITGLSFILFDVIHEPALKSNVAFEPVAVTA